MTLTLQNLAELLFSEGDYQGAIVRVRDAVAIDREFQCERSLMFGLVNLAAYALAVDEITDALRCAQEALEIAVRRQQPMQAAWAIQHLAQIAAMSGRSEVAARLLGYVDAVCAREGTVREPTEQGGYDRAVAMLRDALPPHDLARLMHPDSAALCEEAAVNEALAISEPTGKAAAST